MDVPTLLEELGRTPSASARATGLSRMTIQRVRDGISSPTLTTLRELALAAGYDLDVTLVPPSDPAAAIAARVMLDPAMPSIDEMHSIQGQSEHLAEIAAWIDRFQRYQPQNPAELLALAGRYSAPQHRKGARFYAPRPGLSRERTLKTLGHTGAASGGKYAISGMPSASYYLAETAVRSGPVLLWTDRVQTVAALLDETFRATDAFQPGGVVVAPAIGEYFIDTLTDTDTGFLLASPIQTAIDLHGLGYAELAELLTKDW